MTTYLNKIFILSSLLLGFGACLSTQEDISKTEISNELIQAEIYLPDRENGYYRATRFDWSGVIASLEYNGHQYFGRWFDDYDPYTHDAILGPVEEFTPLGFEETVPGDHFVMIGVGALKRPDENDHNRFLLYEIADYGEWIVETYNDRVVFIHELSDINGYSYEYHKIVKLTEDQPELVLEHKLKNTGTRVIETSVYNHNFFTIDEEPTGPGIRIIFPFDVYAEGTGFGSIAKTVGNEIQYIRQLKKGENVFSSDLQGFGDTSEDYDIRIENMKTGAGVRITGDHPIERLVFWASSRTSCPEPYIHLKVEPGEEIQWGIRYEFYIF